MERIKDYYIGKPCTMNVGADGRISWAVGRITGKVSNDNPLIINFTTPHGSTFETLLTELYELSDTELLKTYEKSAKKKKIWYGNKLNDVPYNIMKLK